MRGGKSKGNQLFKMRPFWLPLITAVFLLTTLTCSYLIAILNDHVGAIWPMISDTGRYVPESCIFSLFLNTTAAFGTLNVIMRYLQVSEYYLCLKRQDPSRRWLYFHRFTLIIGFVMTFGLSMVANFQVKYCGFGHNLGASLAFGFGTLYMLCQVVISYRRVCRLEWAMAHFRLLLTLIAIGCAVYYTVLGPRVKAIAKADPDIVRLHWRSDQPYYGLFLSANISEWLLALALVLYLLSYTFELRKMEFVDMEVKWNKRNKKVVPRKVLELKTDDVSFVRLTGYRIYHV